ncbi:Bifunctional enzyme Fae/Hps [Candidatus Gugararchaeum adminiculabundum]|nr:Bifunctional enzyme Fae/Hps [Candidatus Gugararchaeum adminiculabundum]
MPKKTILQLALDLPETDRAIAIASEAANSIDWVEAGTVLIKSEGMNAVRALRKKFPRKLILADLKTFDTGELEAELAFKAGANIVTVLATADSSTISEAVKAAKRYKGKVMVDVMNASISRVKEVQSLGIDYLCLHVGIDMQNKGHTVFDRLHEIKKIANVPIACAGGLTSETAPLAAKQGAQIIIIGGAITKAANAGKAAAQIRRALKLGKPFASGNFAKFNEKNIGKAFARVSAPNLSDAMHRGGQMLGIKSIVPGAKMFGRAFTVSCAPGDWAKPVEAIDEAKKGDVIVIDAGGKEIACWGGLASASARRVGIAGVVIDGGARDIDEIRKLKFPAFARHLTPAAGDPKGAGSMQKPIVCGKVLVKPGDYIIGDDSGVVVVPREKAAEIANRAIDVNGREGRIKAEIAKGSTLSKVLKLKKWELVHSK